MKGHLSVLSIVLVVQTLISPFSDAVASTPLYCQQSGKNMGFPVSRQKGDLEAIQGSFQELTDEIYFIHEGAEKIHGHLGGKSVWRIDLNELGLVTYTCVYPEARFPKDFLSAIRYVIWNLEVKFPFESPTSFNYPIHFVPGGGK